MLCLDTERALGQTAWEGSHEPMKAPLCWRHFRVGAEVKTCIWPPGTYTAPSRAEVSSRGLEVSVVCPRTGAAVCSGWVVK